MTGFACRMITLKDIVLHRGPRTLLDHANLTLNPGEKVGLVGRNGAGKSTLFALIDGSLQEDSGSCQVPHHWRKAQVAQQMPETTQSATEFVVEGDAALVAARAEVAAAEGHSNGERLAHAYAALHDAGEADARPRAQALILGLGFSVEDLEKPVNSFSGGWRMRLQLARALMCPSDLLLLDEPTNHLDLDALVWLENWLKRYAGTLIVISHDRDFLDAVTQVTVHIEHGKLVRYGGNYSQFETMRAERLALQQSAYERQQEKIAHLQKFITRFKAKATKARQAQSRVKALERMEKLAPLLADAEFTFEFAPPAQLPNPMLSLRKARLGYSRAAAPVLREVNLTLMAGQRIGILGANGQGKSTLVKTIAGVLPALEGERVEGQGLHIGYFAQQEMDLLDAAATPLLHFIRLAKQMSAQGEGEGRSMREQDLRNFLGQFQFGGERIEQPVGTLSGGEKARLVLAMIVWQRPNLLLLDEPTNHLDLATREALSVALNEFEGTVLLVSHDRALLREVCDEFWLVSRGQLAPFDGDLEDYQRHLLEVAREVRDRSATADSGKAVRGAAREAAKAAIRSTSQLRRRLEKTEQQMAALQRERASLEAALATTDQLDRITDLGQRIAELSSQLELLEADWLSLSLELE
jgi:ATP-binding cassette subfamily F protein 3